MSCREKGGAGFYRPRAVEQASSSSFAPGDEPVTHNIDGLGIFFVRKDRISRKRRREFKNLCKSQRAKIVKSAYSVLEAVCETMCPGEPMMLLDGIFTNHKAQRMNRPPSASTSISSEARSAASYADAPLDADHSLQPWKRVDSLASEPDRDSPSGSLDPSWLSSFDHGSNAGEQPSSSGRHMESGLARPSSDPQQGGIEPYRASSSLSDDPRLFSGQQHGPQPSSDGKIAAGFTNYYDASSRASPAPFLSPPPLLPSHMEGYYHLGVAASSEPKRAPPFPHRDGRSLDLDDGTRGVGHLPPPLPAPTSFPGLDPEVAMILQRMQERSRQQQAFTV